MMVAGPGNMEQVKGLELNQNAQKVYDAVIDAHAKSFEAVQNTICGPVWVGGDYKFGNFAVPTFNEMPRRETLADIAGFYAEDFFAGISAAVASLAPADPIEYLLNTMNPLIASNTADGFRYHQWALENCLRTLAATGHHENVDNWLNRLIDLQFMREFDRELYEALAMAFAMEGNEERSRFLLQGAVIGVDNPGELTARVNRLLS